MRTDRERKKLPRSSKILVLDLDRIAKLVQLFDELGIKKLDDQQRAKAALEFGDDRPESVRRTPCRFYHVAKASRDPQADAGRKRALALNDPSGD